MNRLARALERIAKDLASHEVDWCLVGGLAVSVRTEPRFTRDIDIAVHVANDHEAEQLIASLRRKGYQILAIVEQEAIGRLATVRLVPPGEESSGVVVDVLFASSGIEPELVRQADRVSVFAGVEVRVARAAHLLALKLLSRDRIERPQDDVDLRLLIAHLTREDLQVVRDSLRLITQRQTHRGKHLLTEFEEFLTETGECG